MSGQVARRAGPSEAHREHSFHALDLGRVEAAERLVEHFRALPMESKGGRTMRSEVRAGRRKSVHVGWLRRRRTGVHGEQGPIKAGGARARAERT